MSILQVGSNIYSNENGGGDSPTPSGILVALIDNTTTQFPTHRPDGSSLQNEDYVQVRSNAICPFTVQGLTFANTKSKAFYFNGTWQLDAGVIQDTKETPLANSSLESLSGTAINQQEMNIEVKNRLKFYHHKQEQASSEWVVHHNLGTTILEIMFVDSSGSEFYASHEDIDNNSFKVSFKNAIAGDCYIKVF